MQWLFLNGNDFEGTWISVKKKLPEFSQEVLIYIDSFGQNSYLVGTYEDDGLWHSVQCDHCCRSKVGTEVGPVTHWALLPDEPYIEDKK